MLSAILYSENSGNGKVIDSQNFNDKQYSHIIPDSIGYKVYKFVCNKK